MEMYTGTLDEYEKPILERLARVIDLFEKCVKEKGLVILKREDKFQTNLKGDGKRWNSTFYTFASNCGKNLVWLVDDKKMWEWSGEMGWNINLWDYQKNKEKLEAIPSFFRAGAYSRPDSYKSFDENSKEKFGYYERTKPEKVDLGMYDDIRICGYGGDEFKEKYMRGEIKKIHKNIYKFGEDSHKDTLEELNECAEEMSAEEYYESPVIQEITKEHNKKYLIKNTNEEEKPKVKYEQLSLF